MRQRRLLAELRRLRQESGETAEQVAESIGLSKSTVSRIENGQVTLKLPVLRALLAKYHANEELTSRLEALTREANLKGWWQVAGPTDSFKTLVGLEAEARWINYFATSIILGLFQTREYAEALLNAIFIDASPEDLQLKVDLRVKRQERLPELRVWMVLGEEALLRPIGGRQVMSDQIDHLIDRSNERNTVIQILPFEVGAHSGLGGGYEMIGLDSADPEAVYIEGARWDACIEDKNELDNFARAFEHLRAAALSPVDSRLRMQQIRETYRDGATNG